MRAWGWRDVRLIRAAVHSSPVGARKITEAGGSLRDIQQLAGHASLEMTQRYIEGDSEAKRKLVEMI